MTIIQREVRKRGLFGKLAKLLFVLFNLVMAAWLVGYWMEAGDRMVDLQSDAEKAGGAVGATIATGMLLFLWATGSVILGLLTFFTRGKRILITEETSDARS